MIIRSDKYILRRISNIPLLISKTSPINNIWLYELNEIGALIWENCDDCDCFDSLINKIEQYFVDSLNIENIKQIKEFMYELQNIGLIGGI